MCLIGDPHSKVHGANMGPSWDRQDPGGPHVGPINFDIWGIAWSRGLNYTAIGVNNLTLDEVPTSYFDDT